MDLMFGVHQHLMVTSIPCSNGIFTKEWVLSLQNCHNWRQSAKYPRRKKKKKKKAKCHLETFWFHYLLVQLLFILSFMKLLIFLINIPFEHGEDVTIRCWWTPNIRSIHRMAWLYVQIYEYLLKKNNIFL